MQVNTHGATVEGVILKIKLEQLHEHIDLLLAFFTSYNVHLDKCSSPMAFLKLATWKALEVPCNICRRVFEDFAPN